MNKTILKEILSEQNNYLQKQPLGVLREKLTKIKPLIKLPHIIIIAGLRRSGKSYLLNQIRQTYYQQKGYYCNFEDERFVGFTANDFNVLYETFLELFGEQKTFFLDEIQNVPEWERFARRMQDRGYKLFITGSNATLLSKELGTKLTGRHIQLSLFPFNFKEYLEFNKVSLPIKSGIYLTSDRAQLKRHFNLYLKTGGIPEYLIYQRREILENIYNDILFKDIAVRYGLKEITALRQLALFTLSNSGAKISYTALKNTLSLNSPHTVKAYIEYLENSFLVSQLHQYHSSLKVQYYNQKKIYCIDTGLMESLGASEMANIGHKLETIVYLSLRQKNQNIYYYLTESGSEIDFCIKEGNKITQLVQVADNMESPETRKREISALEQGLSEHRNASGIIITADTEDDITVNQKKISITPIYQWLLEK